MGTFSVIRAWVDGWFADPWPHAKPLPPHVQAVTLNMRLMHLHMSSSNAPSDRTNTGYTKPSKDIER